MVEEIDQGEVLAKAYLDVSDTRNLDVAIRRRKYVGGEVAAEVPERIATDEVDPRPMEGEGSYFSFPSVEDRREFQRRG